MEAEKIESFHGVYLLYNLSDEYKGRVYIGFTVDPNRRIDQHNKGVKSGGAKKTSNRGPWEMVLIIHGFPNEIQALRFEWAWQNPKKSRRIRHVTKKSPKEKRYDYTLRILFEMLRTGPWRRLPLTIRWLNEDYKRDFPAHLVPPFHMAIAYGPVKSVRIKKQTLEEEDDSFITNEKICGICDMFVKVSQEMACLHPSCESVCHVACLSRYFLRKERGEYVPLSGECPKCRNEMLWGDLVRKKNGCYNDL